MAEQLGQPLSDGSYWTINLNITELSPSNSPPEGLLKIDIRINRTCLVVYQDKHGNPTEYSEEFELFHNIVPTLQFPGTMNSTQYYSALHECLQSMCFDLPFEGNVVNDFTEHVIERIFERVDLHEKLAICVAADLNRVSVECAPYTASPIESDEDEEEDEEDLPDYWIQDLSD